MQVDAGVFAAFSGNDYGIEEEGQTMAKKKVSLDKDKLKAFFILHSEKIVCALFVVFMGMLCWKAYGLEMYKQTPARTRQQDRGGQR